jgi:chromate transporter
MIQPIPDGEASRARPGMRELFLAFAGVSVMGFGGVMPWARRMLVEQRNWLNPLEFNEAYSLSQFLPGGNILNLAVVIGQRFRGAAGALVAVAGLLAGPVVIVSLVGLLYLRYGDSEAVHGALAGVAAGAAGLILSMAAKMAEPLLRARAVPPLALALAVFVAIGLAELSLALVLAVLVPVSVALAWWRL